MLYRGCLEIMRQPLFFYIVCYAYSSSSIDKDRQKWLEAVEKNNYKGLHLLEQGGALNIKEYNIFALPYSFLVNQGGIITNVNSPLDSIRMKLDNI